MNREIKRIIKRKQELKKVDGELQALEELIKLELNGYDPFTMDISEEEYLSKKKSDVSCQTKTSDGIDKNIIS